MNKKLFYIIVFLISVLFLSGCCCSSISTSDTELIRVREIIDGFWSAINNENWTYASAYCLYDPWDKFVRPYQDDLQVLRAICPDAIVSVYAYVSDISFIDAYTAEAKIQVNTIVLGCGPSNETRVQFGTMKLRHFQYSGFNDWLIMSIDLK